LILDLGADASPTKIAEVVRSTADGCAPDAGRAVTVAKAVVTKIGVL